MDETLNAKQLQSVITETLIKRGVPHATAKITSGGFLQGIASKGSLDLRGLGLITLVGPDCYSVQHHVESSEIMRAEPSGPFLEELEKQQTDDLKAAFLKIGYDEKLAANAAGIVRLMRAGKRVD